MTTITIIEANSPFHPSTYINTYIHTYVKTYYPTFSIQVLCISLKSNSNKSDDELTNAYISTRKDTGVVGPRHPTAERGIHWLLGRRKDRVQVQAGPWVAVSPLPRPQEWQDELSLADP